MKIFDLINTATMLIDALISKTSRLVHAIESIDNQLKELNSINKSNLLVKIQTTYLPCRDECKDDYGNKKLTTLLIPCPNCGKTSRVEDYENVFGIKLNS